MSNEVGFITIAFCFFFLFFFLEYSVIAHWVIVGFALFMKILCNFINVFFKEKSYSQLSNLVWDIVIFIGWGLVSKVIWKVGTAISGYSSIHLSQVR